MQHKRIKGDEALTVDSATIQLEQFALYVSLWATLKREITEYKLNMKKTEIYFK